jgi:DNA-binding transcriptional MocR family regulator
MLQYKTNYVTERMNIRGRSTVAIAVSLEDEVHAGRIVPGGALPTVRELAARLRVSPATVAAAYKVLRNRGLVAGAGRGGTRVTPRPPSPAAARIAAATTGLIDLASGNPDPALLPPLEAALRSISHEPHLYGDPAEMRPLMSFLAAEFDADHIPSGSIALVSGALDGVERVLREHLRTGDAVAVEDPSFPGILDLLSAAGHPRVPFALDDEGAIPEALDAALRRTRAVIVTPRAQNPTGATLSAERARTLRRILRAHPHVLLIENDPFGPVAGAPAHSLHDAGVAHWAVIRSTSKFLGPDLRLAALAGDERTVARVEGRQSLGARWVSTILQRLVLALWSDPSSGRLLVRAAEIYTQRRGALLAALAAHGVAAHGASGFNVWIPVRQEAPVVAALAAAGWGVMAGERFRINSPPAIRVTGAELLPVDADRFAADLAAISPTGSSRVAAS